MASFSIASAKLAIDPVDPSSVIHGNPIVSNLILWTSKHGDRIRGIWEITPGVVTDTEADEIFVVRSGRATIKIDGDGDDEYEVGPGSVGMFRSGTRTTWIVHETLRKAYEINKGTVKFVEQGLYNMRPCVIDEVVLEMEADDPSKIVSGTPKISNLVLWHSLSRNLQNSSTVSRYRGIWEITPGVVTDTESDELFVVQRGRASIEIEGHGVLQVGPGSVGMFAQGMKTKWTVHETLRKAYEIYESDASDASSGTFQRSSL
jgi:uncharacterized cupin superfamily protein